jgi:hypothetical protein
MNETHKIDVELKKGEVLWYNFSHIRWIIIADIIGLLVFIYIAYLSFIHPESSTRDLLETFSIWMAVALAIGLAQPLVIILQVLFAKPEIMQKMVAERSYFFSDSGIEIISLGQKANKIWDDVIRIRNINKLLLIYTGKKAAYVIPRRCFKSAEKWQSFIKYVKGKIRN